MPGSDHRRILSPLGLAALAAAAAACGEGATAPTTGVAGARYALQTFAGSPLPVVLDPSVPVPQELVADTIAFGTAGAFMQTVVWRDDPRLSGPLRAPVVYRLPGTYAQAGDTVRLREGGAAPLIAVVAGAAMAVYPGDSVGGRSPWLVYRRVP